MHYNPSLPIYIQVEAELIKDMLNGKLPPGERLPSGRDLAVKYKINPNTASRVYQELELKGLCFTKRGMGTFVTEDERRLKTERERRAKEYTEEYVVRMKDLSISRELIQEYVKEEIDASVYKAK
ncbi:GntR family transcriptional regulator [Oribacterium asaccharolyticum]|uniref:GntR family transcriptional regulator n=1 Tax=Oribacterium asaccharolyticum TaxID=1501332 RepID=UPI0028E96FFA|nr:GntR family transcriptional regulator [Oribacterium asaccharolyticum]